MALLFPVFSRCRFDTTGERRFAERLTQKLEDDYLCWHNAPVGSMKVQPDFVVMHPRRGFLILEVKDWKLETILSLDATHATLLVNGHSKVVTSPMAQARFYTLQVANMLGDDPQLLHPKGHPHAGNFLAPHGWGVVLTNITREQFNQTNLGDVLEPARVMCKDEMLESVDAEAFQQRLWNMFHHVFPCHLSLPQIDRVRYHLFPEVRINPQNGQFGLFDANEAPIPSLIKVMDLQQEQLARSLGDGHRVIHGVAGSGKTMILCYRSVYLAQTSAKPVLVLCFNRPLTQRLTQVIAEHGLQEKVQVRSFLSWCRAMLVAYNMDLPPESAEDFYEALVSRAMQAVELGHIPRAQYAAILIDEGQDFKPDWYRLVVQMLDPSNNSLLVLYDDAQSIYGKRLEPALVSESTATNSNKLPLGKRKFSFASVGVQAQGRTTILKINYRNTLEVLTVARSFAAELLTCRDAAEDDVPLVEPQSTGRRGAFPELLKLDTEWGEINALIARIREAHGQGTDLSDIAVLCRDRWQIGKLQSAFLREGIACVSADHKLGLFQAEDAVKLLTLHVSKGLEFQQVFIPFLGTMPRQQAQTEEDARLLYVGMTRAIERLVLLGSKPSAFMTRMESAIAAGKLSLQAPDDVLV
ncbi:DNA helicase II [Lampropedia aestuarii]|uniref:DNA helicase II n=1 Tax=Lampropedia aestuarii TaxID=2562762 RepID=A0A4S5BNJ7_9BURK|nr:3'-5' exonuclease [Lampropedia aestuarii]THJ32451.1 DNA helicase II [Lampropedia aestuarii]